MSQAPILFANSFPKSGTHLLTQVLRGFTRIGPAVDSGLPAIVTFNGDTGEQLPSGEILADLNRLRPGDVAYGHLHALPGIISYLCRDGVAPYFILRDPRDVVVSHVHYVTDMAHHQAHHEFYAKVLYNFDERLKASILGRPDWGQLFPDVAGRFEPYLGWLDLPEVLTVQYEGFISAREETIGSIVEHAVARGFQLVYESQEAIRILGDSIDPHRSPTFRSGKAGGWRELFTPEHRRLFKDVAGDLLIRLGYEKDYDW